MLALSDDEANAVDGRDRLVANDQVGRSRSFPRLRQFTRITPRRLIARKDLTRCSAVRAAMTILAAAVPTPAVAEHPAQRRVTSDLHPNTSCELASLACASLF
jgi:hypothetical protein